MKNRLLTLVIGMLAACTSWAVKPVNVIIETDMGNDIDDALAFDLAYKAMDDGLLNILAVGAHKYSPTAVDYIDALNTWYGYGKIPIARSTSPVINTELRDYTMPTVDMRKADGKRLWKFSKKPADIEDPVTLYRRILAAQPDTSVVFISLGFSTETAKLLDSKPDRYSTLNGKDLVKQKVKYLSIMGGSYGAKQRAEYNIVNDIPAAQKVFAEWPTKIIQNPFEIGPKVKYRGKNIDKMFSWTKHHPVIDAYKFFKKMPYDRQSWDLLSVIYVTYPEMFTEGEPGKVKVDDKGFTIFTPNPTGNVIVLDATPEQLKQLDNYINTTTARKPKHFKK